jgi:hypothetical protein
VSAPVATPADRAEGELAPLVAVCGAQGGAGTTTLAQLIALSASAQSSRGVLLCDTGGPAAALAAYVGERSRLGLAHASEALTRGQLPRGLFVSLDERLRMIATGAASDEPGYDPAGLELVLEHARAAHELTVIDCGTLQRPIEREVAALATRVVWACRADELVAVRARAAIVAASLPRARGEVIVARGDERAARGSGAAALMALAEERRAALVFCAELAGAARAPQAALVQLRGALEAIGRELR